VSRKRTQQRKPAKSADRATEQAAPPPQPASTRRGAWALALAAGALVAVAGFAYWVMTGGSSPTSVGTREEAPSFVGSETCAGCHAAQAGLWHGSQHAHAMDHATDKTVLGDFNDASIDYFGVHSRFYRKDGKFFVETDGPDGKLAPFEVKYTFGLDPLQQYLVEFPDGRIQALSLAWDSRPKEKGGQRWFHLYPHEEIKAGDPLHWTKLNQNWNFMCAECHSTGVHKNYDAKADNFHTTWSEISIGCEACHGKGSRHVAWAKARDSLWGSKDESPDKGLAVLFHERNGVTWTRDANTKQPVRNATPAPLRKEVETCGLCHARRGIISEDWVPGRALSDTHMVAMLSSGLYQPDGQMLDEVYNYGSFKQSKMFQAGVTCSDCHDPHSGKLKLAGDNVCLQCHAESYKTAAHNHHKNVTPAVTCVACHMPARTYMVIDERHDHSFRVPRPDLSTALGTTNACNDCHKDKSADWAAAAITDWFGPERKGLQTYGPAFHAGWNDEAGAAQLLTAVASDGTMPSFARASALSALAAYISPATLKAARSGLADQDPMVRLGTLDMLDGVPARDLWPHISPLLTDPSLGVRTRAAFLLAGMPPEGLQPQEREKLARATAEFIAAQELNADRPEARAMLGSLYMRRGETDKAEQEYEAALRLSPAYGPAAANLADLYRGLGRDMEAESVLRKGLEISPQDAGLHHALGLTLVRLKREGDALPELARATEIEPSRARYAYVYAVALYGAGKREDAVKVLKENLVKHPEDRDTLGALLSFSREAGDNAAALNYAETLLRLDPNNEQLKAVIQSLRQPAAPAQ
jgi:predicted CXXCH cytochrome family protein